MKSLLQKTPALLIISRVLMGVAIAFLSFTSIPERRIFIFWLIVSGFLTDFLDGYIARLLGISTQKLRRFDTLVDRVFWLCILFAVWRISPGFLLSRTFWILFVLALEILNYLISYIRFRKEIATHAILSKLWAVTLLAGFCDLILHGNSYFLFDLSIIFGILSRIDTGLIMLILPKWDHDIPSFYHAILLRKGKEIRRIRLFNG